MARSRSYESQQGLLREGTPLALRLIGAACSDFTRPTHGYLTLNKEKSVVNIAINIRVSIDRAFYSTETVQPAN
jgi:hypothetical protein